MNKPRPAARDFAAESASLRACRPIIRCPATAGRRAERPGVTGKVRPAEPLLGAGSPDARPSCGSREDPQAPARPEGVACHCGSVPCDPHR